MADVEKLARALTVSERLELIGALWDSIAAEVGDALEVTDAEREELDRRLAAHDDDPDAVVPWNDARSRRP